MRLTITEQYFADRDASRDRFERWRNWRTYAFAVMGERKRRGLDNNDVDWRRSALDDGLIDPKTGEFLLLPLPVAYEPYWAAIPADELLTLYIALERARMGDQP